MAAFVNPALVAFQASLATPREFLEVLVSTHDRGYELRHRADRATAPEKLRPLQLDELPAWADFTHDGAFRPNKAAPSLRSGWRCNASEDGDLGTALDSLYPGALADWFAEDQALSPAVSLDAFVGRQTGIYRNIQKLDAGQLADATRAICHQRFCLRRRSWSVGDAAPDTPESKSSVPCWEPCALWLEFARRAARVAEETPTTWDLRPSELRTLREALTRALAAQAAEVREGDSSHPGNPRRIQMLLNRLAGGMDLAKAAKET